MSLKRTLPYIVIRVGNLYSTAMTNINNIQVLKYLLNINHKNLVYY